MVELCVAEGENAEVDATVCWVEPDTFECRVNRNARI
jgi:hypothetical protein